MINPILEICTGDIDSVRAAVEGGASRIELCSALSEGGVTPSLGLLKEARRFEGLLIHVLIRPRGGDFLYSPAEVDCMAGDVKAAIEAGADGVVIGALLPDGSIDIDTCRRLIECADGRNVTFHRAFDMCSDPESALETVISLGCNRILTSGCAPTAKEGIPMLRKLIKLAGERLTILPGGGVNPDNAALIMRETGCRELHASAKHSVASLMAYRNPAVAMGTPGADEYSRNVTNAQTVRHIIEQMKSISSPKS